MFFLAVAFGGIRYVSNLQADLRKEMSAFDENAWREAVEESGINLVEKGLVAEAETVANPKIEAEAEQIEVEPVAVDDTVSVEEEPIAMEASVEAEKPFSMVKPCEGDIIAHCSLEELVYCNALDDWRTHNGVDYTAKAEAPVFATADGVISKVFEDELLGLVLVLDHQNGVSSVYGNIKDTDVVTIGASVKQGEVIGAVGASGTMESDMAEHLHFEVQCNGEYKDPLEYIKAQ